MQPLNPKPKLQRGVRMTTKPFESIKDFKHWLNETFYDVLKEGEIDKITEEVNAMLILKNEAIDQAFRELSAKIEKHGSDIEILFKEIAKIYDRFETEVLPLKHKIQSCAK